MTQTSYGSCYGFDITSDVPLSFLRTSTGNGTPMSIRSGVPPEENGTLLLEWNLDKASKLTTQLLETAAGRYQVKIGNDNSYQVTTRPPSIIVHPSPIDEIERESMILGTPAAVSMAHQGRLPFHAGSVDVNGQGLILAATGTFGKTTLAGAFHAAGYRLLADDMSCSIVDPEPVLLPGPAVIRARPDVAAGFAFERTTPALITPGRTYYVLDAATRGNGDPVPLRAIVFLRISDGPIVLEPAPVADAVRDLFGLSFRLPTDEGQAAAFSMAADLVGRVPVWNLERPLTLKSLPAVIATVVEHCLD